MMPKNKDLKHLIRYRMKKTGESYTTARARLLEKKHRTSSVPAEELAALAGMSNDAVRAKTGRNWREWVDHLDGQGAASMPHREIAKHVHDQFEISGWWSQMVTVGYERIRGLREKGQRRSGTYEANKSKALPFPITKLYRAFSVARTRNRWLPGVKLTVRKSTADKSMCFTWEDGNPVNVTFTAKDDNKTQVAVQHRMLATKSDASKLKAYWEERLAALSEILAGSKAAGRS
jgi:hypothetical protein